MGLLEIVVSLCRRTEYWGDVVRGIADHFESDSSSVVDNVGPGKANGGR